MDALLSMDEVQTEGSSSINEIELDKISVNPNQPRRDFDPVALQELADSIAEIGIIQPITLRQMGDDTYQIIAGERRFRASQLAGLSTIPAYIRTADDENVMEMALIENIQREDLNSVEIALAYQHLIEQYGLTQERLSERVGKKRTTIANYLRLLKLPAPIQIGLQNKQIDRARPRPAHVGRPQTSGESVRRNPPTQLRRPQGGGNCEGLERRRSDKKRRTQNCAQTSQTARRIQHTEATTLRILQRQGATHLLGKRKRENQHTVQQRGRIRTHHRHLRHAKKQMTNRQRNTYRIAIALLFCFVQAAGIGLYGQARPRAAMKRAHSLQTDSLKQPVLSIKPTDSIAMADSIAAENKRKMLEMTAAPKINEPKAPTDSLSKDMKRKQWVPNPVRATWLALIIPGGGQIYNRKYWKLPIFYGGFAGCAYALAWNGKMYRDYFNAYRDVANGNLTSSNVTDLVPPSYIQHVSQSQLVETLRRRKDTYRRYRDLSIFAFIGVYLLSVVDAYVDAELSNFDITPDLSMRVEPAVIDTQITTSHSSNKSVGLQCSFRF